MAARLLRVNILSPITGKWSYVIDETRYNRFGWLSTNNHRCTP
jgi:hypothetical protein